MPQTDAFGDLVGGFGMGIAAVAMNIETELPPMAEPILPGKNVRGSDPQE